MDKRAVMICFSAGVAAAIAGILGSLQPLVLAVVGGVAIILVVLLRLDWWQRFYTLTLVLMVGATSNIALLLTVSNYGRYAAAAALLGVTWLTTRKTPPVIQSRLHSRLLVTLWLTVALAAASIVWSVDRMQSALQVIALGILVGLVHLLSTRRWTDRALMAQDFRVMFNVLTAVFLACLAAAALHLPGAIAYGGTADTVGRFQGIFNNPNMLALLSAISIPLGWGVFREKPNLLRFVLLLPAAANLLLTESRTAIIATATALVWLIFRAGAVSITKFAFAGLAVAVALLSTGLNPFGKTLSRFGTMEGGDLLNTRGDAWASAISLVQREPLGYGWQAGRQLFESLQGTADFTFTRTSVHNSYLQFVLELGILGILPLAYLSITLLILVVRGRIQGVEAGFVGVILSGLIVQITESAIFGTGQAYPYVFWLAVAAAVTLYNPPPNVRQVAKPKIHRRSLAGRDRESLVATRV
jgi:O-antigen ligase